VLDALDASGRVSFNLLQHHRSKAQALLFYAFDVLIYHGRSLVALPLSTRREVLSEIFKERGSGAAPLGISEAIDATPADLVRVAKEFGFEGIVVAQIEFIEWTPDGHLRHSKFIGLRDDKDAREVVRETED